MKEKLLLCILFSFSLFSCRKSDENLDISMDDYAVDIPVTSSELDKWLNTNFNIPWNINVEYRFDRYESDYDRNIAAIDLDKVKPSMQAMITNFIEPYTKIVDSTFGKKYFPKQWVLYGSGSYNNDGTFVLGTASNGVRVNLFNLNNFSASASESVRRIMRTVHHEFTHVLNQTTPIPTPYELISQGDYDPSWAGKAEAAVRDMGFVSTYASSASGEDFAEMVSHIVVEGPVWYNNFLALASATGQTRLKQKEAIIYEYLKNYFNVDLYKLQAAVQTALKTNYGVTDPVDITTQFPFKLANNKVSTIVITPDAAHYTTYGSSTAFNTVLTNYTNAIKTNSGSTYLVRYLQFTFNSATSMTFRVAFATSATSTTIYYGDYDFTYTIAPATGLATFIKTTPEGTGTVYSNGQLAFALNAFEMYILPYLVNRQFVAAYLPGTIPSTDALYGTYAGFYVNGTATNYFYGPVTYK